MINNNPFNSNNTKIHEDRAFERFSNNYMSKTALLPKGKLVRENPIQAAKSNATALKNDVVNLGVALKDGYSSDYSLGRMNDLGIKLGAAGIAGYLFTRKTTPKAKLMEFAGAGVFLGVMQLWQKLFIAAPIKARFGVDINQKYVDSMGNVKRLGMDNQFIPQLETDEELDKMADNMGLPKNMEFRREYAREKRRKLMLQGNTLNLLAAGAATPVMTALLCNKIEDMVDSHTSQSKLIKSIKDVDNMQETVNKKATSRTFGKENSDIIRKYSKYTGKIDDTFFNGLADAYNPVYMIQDGKLKDMIPDITSTIAEDLKSLYASSMDVDSLSKDVYELFFNNAKENGDSLVIKPVIPQQEQICTVEISKQELQNTIKKVVDRVKKGEIEYDSREILKALDEEEKLSKTVEISKTRLSDANLDGISEAYGKSNKLSKKQTETAFRVIFDKLKDTPDIDANNDTEIKGILAEIESKLAEAKSGRRTRARANKIDEAKVKDILQIIKHDNQQTYTVTRNFKAIPENLRSTEGKNALNQCIEQSKKRQFSSFMQKVENGFDSIKKIGATLSGADDALKSLDASFGREDTLIVNTIFETLNPSFEELKRLKSDSTYAVEFLEKAIKEVAKDDAKYKKLFLKINNLLPDADAQRSELVEKLMQSVNAGLNDASNGLDSSLKNLNELTSITSSGIYGYAADVKDCIGRALPGFDASKNRILLTMELEKRIADGTLKQQYEDIMKAYPSLPKESHSYAMFESDCRKILYTSTPGDFSCTHNIKGNGIYFNALNDLLFNQNIGDKTKEILASDSKLLNKLNEMRVTLMAIGSNGARQKDITNMQRGGADFLNPSNVIKDSMIQDSHLKEVFNAALDDINGIKYQKVGKTLRNFAYENANKIFNSKAWMKIFAPLAVGIAGITLFAQLFIGRDKDQHLYMKKRTNSGAVNGN